MVLLRALFLMMMSLRAISMMRTACVHKSAPPNGLVRSRASGAPFLVC